MVYKEFFLVPWSHPSWQTGGSQTAGCHNSTTAARPICYLFMFLGYLCDTFTKPECAFLAAQAQPE